MNAGELHSVPAARPRERRHSHARRSAATVLAALLGAWLHASATSVGATPPSQDPYHALAPSMGLEEAQATLEPGKPVAAWLEFTRPPGTSTLQLLLSATDATVEIEAGDVTASFLETSAEGDLYEIDASALPEGGKNRLALTLVLEGETGAGVTARLWDVAAAAPADAWLAFAVDESGVVTPVERAGDVTAAHLKRFEAADDWARAEVLRSETATWEAPVDDPDPYRVTDPNLRKRIRWPKGSGAARSASKKIHRLWDANIGRGSGVRFAGRLVFRDDAGCASPTRAHNIAWNQCHAFKRRLDASMQPVTVDAPVSPGYRPLPATVILLYEAWRDGAREKVCDITAFETSLDGRFMVELQPCNVAPGGTLEYRLQATVTLEALMIGDPSDPDAELGTMRAVWPIERMDALFPPGPSPDVVRWLRVPADRNNPGTLYTVPALRFTQTLTAPEAPGSLTQLGARILAADGPASFNYLRQALSAWATMVTLHERL